MAGLDVILCDDDRDLRSTVAEYLTKRGHATREAGSADELKALLAAGPAPDVLILDIRMPGQDGLSFLRSLPEDRGFAVVMVTAAGEVVDRVVGLEMGADDYLAKPVDLRELEVRLRTVTRRQDRGGGAAAEGPAAAAKIGFDGLSFDPASARLHGRDGSEIPLTAMEHRLLDVFLRHRGQVLSRDRLLELAHDRGWDPFDRSIDIRISRLRRKIERVPEKPTLIRTVRGLGYLFDPPS